MLAPSTTFLSIGLITLAQAAGTHNFARIRREVPQEHSHEQFLTTVRSSLQLNNPRGIKDPVFGLLGNLAAAGGANGIDVACLQQATADQAFTNAMIKNDVAGMTAALVYRSLERNTPGIGKISAACTSEKAKNEEIASLVQHQDPASPNAAALNKAATLALAVQIASIGGDPQIALKAGTFAPGSLSDNSGKGNTCDDQNDSVGCIFTQNKLVEDATPAEISAAVAGKSTGSAVVSVVSNTPAITLAPIISNSILNGAIATVTVTVTASNCLATDLAPLITATATVQGDCIDNNGSTVFASLPTLAPVAISSNLQTFTGALGGVIAPTVKVGGRGFQVAGNASFPNLQNGLQRSCDIQSNQCSNKANSGGGFSVSACSAQADQCRALIKN